MSDMYMHFPHGSNNRLNGNQDNVKNANRLFDSQVGPAFTFTLFFQLIRVSVPNLKVGEVRSQIRTCISTLTDGTPRKCY